MGRRSLGWRAVFAETFALAVAADGNGKNSPFTKALLQHIDGPDDISVVLRKVRAEVMQDTDGKQQPWDYNSLTGGSLILSAIRAK